MQVISEQLVWGPGAPRWLRAYFCETLKAALLKDFTRAALQRTVPGDEVLFRLVYVGSAFLANLLPLLLTANVLIHPACHLE